MKIKGDFKTSEFLEISLHVNATRRCFIGAVLLFLVSIMIGCAGSRRAADMPALPQIEIDEAQTSEDRYRLAIEHFIMARDYERRGMNKEAARLYEIAYGFDPSSHFLRKLLLDVYVRTEEYGKALELLGDDYDLSQMSIEEKRSISVIYMRLGDLEKAAEVIETFGGERSDEETYSLALLYESMGRKDKALQTFKGFFESNRHAVGLGIRLVQFNVGERRLADAENMAVMLRGVFPDNAEVISILGLVRYLGRDTTAALANFNEALALDSLNEEALRTLAHIHVVRKQYPEAVSYYKRLVTLDEVGAVYRRGLAMLLYHTEDYEGAEKIFDEMLDERNISEATDVQELHIYRGLVYSKTGRREEAAREFERAIAADPRNEDAWRELCYLHILAKDHENSVKAVDGYLKAFPLSSVGYRLRGYAFNIAEKREEAAEALRKAVEIDSLDYSAWFELGSTLERMKRIDEAADAFRAALRIRPGDAHASNYLGYMWADANMNLDSAKVLIEDALKAEPENGAFLDSYAWVFYRLGDYETAHRYMKDAIKNYDGDNPDPVLYEHLGDILFKLNDYQNAIDAYNRSLELKSEEAARIRERLAEIRKIINDRSTGRGGR